MRFWSLAVTVATFYLQSHCARVKKWFNMASDGGPCGKIFLNGYKPRGLDQAAVPMDHICQCFRRKCFYVAILRQQRHIPIYWAYSVQEGWPYSHSAEEFANWISNWYTDPLVISQILMKNQTMNFRKLSSKVPGFTYIVSGVVPPDEEDWAGITLQPNTTSVTWSAYHHRGTGKIFEGAIIKKDQNSSRWVKITVKRLEQILSEKFAAAEPLWIFSKDKGTRLGRNAERMHGGETETAVQREQLIGNWQSAANLVIRKEDTVNLKNQNKQNPGNKEQMAHLEMKMMTQIEYTEPENLGRKPVKLKDILQIQEIQMEKPTQKKGTSLILRGQLFNFFKKKLMPKCKKVVCLHCKEREDEEKQHPGAKHNDPGLRPWTKSFEEKLQPRTTPPNAKPLNQSKITSGNTPTDHNGTTQVDTKPAECNTTSPKVIKHSNNSRTQTNDTRTRKEESMQRPWPPTDSKHKNTGSCPETIRCKIRHKAEEAAPLMLGHATEGIQPEGISTEKQQASALSGDLNVENVGTVGTGLENTGCNMTVPVRTRCTGLIHRTAASLQHCVDRKTLHRSRQLLRMRMLCGVQKKEIGQQEKDSRDSVFDSTIYKKNQTYKSCRGLVHPSRKCRRRGLRMTKSERFLEK